MRKFKRSTEEALKRAEREARDVNERDREIDDLGRKLGDNTDDFVRELERVFHKVRRHG